jgi:hypothetical protein
VGRLVVLQSGRIAEMGTHVGGIYAEFVRDTARGVKLGSMSKQDDARRRLTKPDHPWTSLDWTDGKVERNEPHH